MNFYKLFICPHKLHCVSVAIATMRRPKNKWTKCARVLSQSIAFHFEWKTRNRQTRWRQRKILTSQLKVQQNLIGPTRTHKNNAEHSILQLTSKQKRACFLVASRRFLATQFFSWINFLCKKFAQMITIDTRFLLFKMLLLCAIQIDIISEALWKWIK